MNTFTSILLSAALSILALTGSLAFAANYKAEANLTIDQLKQLVIDYDVQTLDQLVPLLPTQMLKNPLLVYDTNALFADRISFQTPRIILFNREASLILAMTKNPGAASTSAGEDRLEIIAFDPVSAKYEMHDVPFDGTASPFDRAAPKNQARCLACHGQNPRPIFADYNAWPGFYGSFSQEGAAVSGTPEYVALEQFLSTRGGLDRYKDLDLSDFTKKAGGFSHSSYGFGSLANLAKFSPLLTFGASTEYLMLRRLAKKLELEPRAKRYASLISYIGRGDECALPVGANHRDVIKKLYQNWSAVTSDVAKSADVGRKIEKTFVDDFLTKERAFTQFNVADKGWDSRGMLTLPHDTFLPTAATSRDVDKTAFLNQLLIMESLGNELSLELADFSTMRSTSGIFHVRSALGLVSTSAPILEDEQMFKGIYDALLQTNSPLIALTRIQSCSALSANAIKELNTLSVPDPTAKGIFY